MVRIGLEGLEDCQTTRVQQLVSVSKEGATVSILRAV